MLVAQSCLTLFEPMGYSLPGFSVHGIHQARILEWVAIPFSRGSSQPRDWTQVSWIAGRFFFTIWKPGKPLSSKSTLYIRWCVRVGQGSYKIRCFLLAGFLLLGPTLVEERDQKTRWEEKGLSSPWVCPQQWRLLQSYSGSGLHFLSSTLETPPGLPIRTSTAKHHSSSKGWVLGQGNSPLGSWGSSSHTGLPPQKSESQLWRTPPWVLTCQLCHTADSLHTPHPKCELWIHRTPPPSC